MEENVRSVRLVYGLHTKYLDDISGKVSDRDYEFGDRLKGM